MRRNSAQATVMATVASDEMKWRRHCRRLGADGCLLAGACAWDVKSDELASTSLVSGLCQAPGASLQLAS